jgi:hypothetical protein
VMRFEQVLRLGKKPARFLQKGGALRRHKSRPSRRISCMRAEPSR